MTLPRDFNHPPDYFHVDAEVYTGPKNGDEAREAGCTCKWWGRGAIVRFDDACPVLETHVGREGSRGTRY